MMAVLEELVRERSKISKRAANRRARRNRRQEKRLRKEVEHGIRRLEKFLEEHPEPRRPDL